MSGHFIVTFTFYWWWLAAYLAVGVVLFLPLNWLALKQTNKPDPFWTEMKRTHWSSWLIQVAFWPMAIWVLMR